MPDDMVDTSMQALRGQSRSHLMHCKASAISYDETFALGTILRLTLLSLVCFSCNFVQMKSPTAVSCIDFHFAFATLSEQG